MSRGIRKANDYWHVEIDGCDLYYRQIRERRAKKLIARGCLVLNGIDAREHAARVFRSIRDNFGVSAITSSSEAEETNSCQ